MRRTKNCRKMYKHIQGTIFFIFFYFFLNVRGAHGSLQGQKQDGITLQVLLVLWSLMTVM